MKEKYLKEIAKLCATKNESQLLYILTLLKKIFESG